MASTSEYTLINSDGKLCVCSPWHDDIKYTITGLLFSFNPQKLFAPLKLQDPKLIKCISLAWCNIDVSFFQAINLNCGDMASLQFFDCDIDFTTFTNFFTKTFVEKFKKIEFRRVRIINCVNFFELGTHRLKMSSDSYFQNDLVNLLDIGQVFGFFEIEFKIMNGKNSIIIANPQMRFNGVNADDPYDYICDLPLREKRPRVA